MADQEKFDFLERYGHEQQFRCVEYMGPLSSINDQKVNDFAVFNEAYDNED